MPGKAMAYLWKGAGSNAQEQACGEKLMENLSMCEERQVFAEGEESEEFWTALGGKQDYHSSSELRVIPGFEPRMLSVSNTTGYMWTKEVPNYTQEDLVNSDVYLLDCYSTVYVWIGRMAEKVEVRGAHKSATMYIAAVKDSRDKDDV